AQQPTDLLRRHLAAVLQPALLRSAILDPAVTPRCYLTEVREKLTGRSDADYPDYVEYLALRRHRLNLVHFVCLLAVHAEPPVDDRHLREWARLLKHEAPLNEIRGQLRAAGRDRKAQLIVTLDPRMDGEWRGTAR